MYTKVYDHVLKLNPGTWQSDSIYATKIPDVIYTYDSQFTLLRFCVTPTLPVDITLKSVDVVWRDFTDNNKTVLLKTKATLYNGYICVVVPKTLADNVTTGGYSGLKKFEFTLIGVTENDGLLMFGVFEIGVVKFTGMEEVRENPDYNDLPSVDTNPMITLLNSAGSGGGDGGSDGETITVIKDYACYSVDKKTATVGLTQQISEYPYVAITDDLDNVYNIDWFCNPNHVGKLLDGLYTESQNFCMFDWATYCLTSTNLPANSSDYKFTLGQISSYVYREISPYKGYINNNSDDKYIKNYYYKKIIGDNSVTSERNSIYCTTTCYVKSDTYNPYSSYAENTVSFNYSDISYKPVKIKGFDVYNPVTVTPYCNYGSTSDISKLMSNLRLRRESSGNVISDYILLSSKTLFKNTLSPDQEAFKINDVIKYTKKAKKEGWY